MNPSLWHIYDDYRCHSWPRTHQEHPVMGLQTTKPFRSNWTIIQLSTSTWCNRTNENTKIWIPSDHFQKPICANAVKLCVKPYLKSQYIMSLLPILTLFWLRRLKDDHGWLRLVISNHFPGNFSSITIKTQNETYLDYSLQRNATPGEVADVGSIIKLRVQNDPVFHQALFHFGFD